MSPSYGHVLRREKSFEKHIYQFEISLICFFLKHVYDRIVKSFDIIFGLQPKVCNFDNMLSKTIRYYAPRSLSTDVRTKRNHCILNFFLNFNSRFRLTLQFWKDFVELLESKINFLSCLMIIFIN